jgi:hypothetical protein
MRKESSVHVRLIQSPFLFHMPCSKIDLYDLMSLTFELGIFYLTRNKKEEIF